MHTESDARKLWCPYARVIIRPVQTVQDHTVIQLDCIAGNRLEGTKLASGTNCIASDCALWEWQPDRDEALETIEWKGGCGLKRRPDITT